MHHDSMLQCGHGEDAVANARPPRSPGTPWHSFNVTTAPSPWKTRSGRSMRITTPCFNGATALSPWKTWIWEKTYGGGSLLQRGHKRK